jgi:hypothetical protein
MFYNQLPHIIISFFQISVVSPPLAARGGHRRADNLSPDHLLNQAAPDESTDPYFAANVSISCHPSSTRGREHAHPPSLAIVKAR